MLAGLARDGGLYLPAEWPQFSKADIAALKGKSVDEAATIRNTQIAEELALPPVKIHCSILAEDAIKAAIADYRKKYGGAEAEPDKKAAD